MTDERKLADAIDWAEYKRNSPPVSPMEAKHFPTLIAAARYAQGMADELARVRGALRNVLDHLTFHDEEGLIEHAEPMIAARAAIAATKAGTLAASANEEG